MNTFGHLLRLTTFGESHGPCLGGVLDGFPAGIEIDMDFLQHELDRRRPGQSALTTARKESDRAELLSGVFEGKSTGCPIGFLVRNEQARSADYDNLRDVFRPSHADYAYYYKYGIRDHRGGGRSSARETVARCVGGALAKMALRQAGIRVAAYTSQVGNIALEHGYSHYDLSLAETNPVRCPDPEAAKEAFLKAAGRGIGGFALDEIEALRPDGTGNTLVSRLRDGTGVILQEQKILPLLQQRILELEEQGVRAILLMCTGEFPEGFRASVPLIYPSKVICGLVAGLDNVTRLGVITPEADQIRDIRRKWERIVPEVVPVLWNPYHEERSQEAADRLREARVDLAVMDCFGYSKKMRDFAAEAISRPVILSRTIAARVLSEIV